MDGESPAGSRSPAAASGVSASIEAREEETEPIVSAPPPTVAVSSGPQPDDLDPSNRDGYGNSDDDNNGEFADLDAQVAAALSIEEGKTRSNDKEEGVLMMEEIPTTEENMRHLTENSLMKLLVKVPEWDEFVLGVYVDEERNTPQEKFFCALVKKEHQVAIEWLKTQCKEREGDCMYFITKQGNDAPEFGSTDQLLNSKLTKEIRRQILSQVFHNFKEYNDAGLVARLMPLEKTSDTIKKTLEECKTWRMKRELLAARLECTRGIMPTEEQMMEQYLHRQEGGGIGVAIPLIMWNQCARVYLAEKARLTLAVQEESVVVSEEKK